MNKLEAHVDAVNRANTVANEWVPRLQAVLHPFIGQKILKADGELTVKVREAIKGLGLPDSNKLSIRASVSSSSFSFLVNTYTCSDEGYHGNTMSYTTYIYVGEIQGANLKSVNEVEAFKTDYSAAQIADYREAYKIAQQHADSIKSKIGIFGER